jgi:hypothetical protein
VPSEPPRCIAQYSEVNEYPFWRGPFSERDVFYLATGCGESLVRLHCIGSARHNEPAKAIEFGRTLQDTLCSGPNPWCLVRLVYASRCCGRASCGGLHNFAIREPVSVVVYFLAGALLLDLPRFTCFHGSRGIVPVLGDIVRTVGANSIRNRNRSENYCSISHAWPSCLLDIRLGCKNARGNCRAASTDRTEPCRWRGKTVRNQSIIYFLSIANACVSNQSGTYATKP